jgi:hypothetical protein
VRALTKAHGNAKQFVESSRRLANHLFEQQLGSVSPGLLCVIDVAASSLSGIVLMKLEREEGAQLQLSEKGGKKTFSMSVLDNLVLTDGTRLFKTAMFLRAGKGDDEFRCAACDSQLNVATSDDFAKFWMRFLGCTFVEEPRVATQKFFEATLRFVNTAVTDPVAKSEIYDALQSELRAAKKTFSPKNFIEEYVPSDYQHQMREHMKEEHVSLSQFAKDTSDIAGRLKRRAYQTVRGAMISIPEEDSELIVVGTDQVIINDTVVKVK